MGRAAPFSRRFTLLFPDFCAVCNKDGASQPHQQAYCRAAGLPRPPDTEMYLHASVGCNNRVAPVKRDQKRGRCPGWSIKPRADGKHGELLQQVTAAFHRLEGRPTQWTRRKKIMARKARLPSAGAANRPLRRKILLLVNGGRPSSAMRSTLQITMKDGKLRLLLAYQLQSGQHLGSLVGPRGPFS